MKDLLDKKKAEYPKEKGYDVDSNKSIQRDSSVDRPPDVSVKKDGQVVDSNQY